MRAAKAQLKSAGTERRREFKDEAGHTEAGKKGGAENDKEEDVSLEAEMVVLVRSLRNYNLSRLTRLDAVIFHGIMADLFPEYPAWSKPTAGSRVAVKCEQRVASVRCVGQRPAPERG